MNVKPIEKFDSDYKDWDTVWDLVWYKPWNIPGGAWWDGSEDAISFAIRWSIKEDNN